MADTASRVVLVPRSSSSRLVPNPMTDAFTIRASTAAATVGAWYLRSRSDHHDSEVIEAYRQLELEE